MDGSLFIDISHWRKVNWSELDPLVDGVIIKATEGDNWTDPTFQSHIENALEKGLMVGVYAFYRTIENGRIVKPVHQAQHFLNVIYPYRSEIELIALDWERSHKLPNGKWYNEPTGNERQALENFFDQIAEDHFYHRMIKLLYGNLATWQEWKMECYQNAWQGPDWLRKRPDIQLWIAYWTEKPGITGRLPRPFPEYFMHQYSATKIYLKGVYSTQNKPCPVDMNFIPMGIDELEIYLKRFHARMTNSRLQETDPRLNREWVDKPTDARMSK